MVAATTTPARRFLQTWVPLLAIFLLIVAEHVPLGRDWLTNMDIGFVFVPMLFLARYSEGFVPPTAILLLGVLKDVTSETPIGFWSFLFCVFFILALGQRQLLYNAAYNTVWATFGFLCFLIYTVFYVLAVLSLSVAPSFAATMLGALLTVLAFPLFNLAFDWLSQDDDPLGAY